MTRAYRRSPAGLAAFVGRALDANPSASAASIWRAWAAEHGGPVAEMVVRRLVARRRKARDDAAWVKVQRAVRAEAILDAWMRRAKIDYKPESVASILARLKPGLGQQSDGARDGVQRPGGHGVHARLARCVAGADLETVAG